MASWHRKTDPSPYEIAEFVISGVLPIGLIVVGTIGNLMSILILFLKDNHRISTNIYLIFLCIVDTISLYQWNLSQTIYTLTGGTGTIWGNSVIMCKLSEFFAFYSLHTSAMFLTFVQLDRAFVLYNRWYKAKVAYPFVALIICAVILVVLFALNGFLLGLGFEYSSYNNSTDRWETNVVCYYTMNKPLNDFFSFEYAWIHLVIMYFLPFSVIIICTLFIVRKLMKKQTVVNQQLAINAQRNRRISILLLFICLAYVFCTLPNRLCFSLFANQIMGHNYTDIIFLSSNTLMYTRNALNVFFLYITTRGFRRDIWRLVSLLFCKTRIVPGDLNKSTVANSVALTERPNRKLAIATILAT